MKIVCALEGGRSTPRQIASNFNEEISEISYHLSVLAQAKCVRVVERRRKRGMMEQLYELTPVGVTGHINRQKIPTAMRSFAAAPILQDLIDDSVSALEQGKLDRDEESRLFHLNLKLDDEGWREVAKVIDDAVERIHTAQDACSQRLGSSQAGGLGRTISLAGFKAPMADADPPAPEPPVAP